MIKRIYQKHLLKKIKTFPIVTILGPRQCGKTTFVQDELSDWKYFDLERPSHAMPFSEDPEGRLLQLKTRCVIDEAQTLPSLFPVFRSLVDTKRDEKGQYILLGSASPHLIKNISESLAGRTTFLELTPFLLSEIQHLKISDPILKLWLQGGFPEPFLMNETDIVSDWFESYTRTFIERDLTAMGLQFSAVQMRRLWGLLAHLNGAAWNASKIANALGVNYQTANRYTDILEQTFLIRKLSPYYTNIGKRLVKSPKIYFRDTGLLHYFLGIHTQDQLDVHPARGESWEAFVIEQFTALCRLYLPTSQFYYWRTSGGAEVDLLIEHAGRIIPFEIKIHSAPSKKMIQGLTACMDDLKIEKGYLIYPGNEEYSLGNNVTCLPIKKLLSDEAYLKGIIE